MTIAHLGSMTGQQGGPAGYLAQLARALDEFGSGGHDVTLPPARLGAGGRPLGDWPVQQWLRRARRTWIGPPAFHRPNAERLHARHGDIDTFMTTAWSGMQDDVRASVEQAVALGHEVLFAHDAAAAELALELRSAGQQVWLFLHTPMAMALYLAWCWGIPEWTWPQVNELPDVHAWVTRELDVVNRVDKVVMPCAEAVDELVRSDRRFADALGRVEFLLTGASAPPRKWPEVSGAALREKCGLPIDQPVGVYIGNAQPYRGFDVLLAALRELPSRQHLPGVVAVAGPAIETIPLSRRVIALGPVSHVADLLTAADFTINVNRFSLFDLSTIEALDAGSPLMMHAVGGNRTFERLGAGATMVPSLDPQVVAGGLAQAFAMSSTERARLSTHSRHCYEQHLTLKHLRDRHVALYDGAMSPGGAPS